MVSASPRIPHLLQACGPGRDKLRHLDVSQLAGTDNSAFHQFLPQGIDEVGGECSRMLRRKDQQVGSLFELLGVHLPHAHC